MEQGNIIFLNGTSSSGKTLISKALQEILEGYYLHTGIDHYLERTPEKMHAMSTGENPSTFDGLLWVVPEGDKCIFEVAEQRERERKDRDQGLVKAHYDLVHSHGIYDLEVDTSILTPVECANQIKRRVENGPAPDAIRRLRNIL